MLTGKEPRNSERSGIRTRQSCGFFVPDTFASGGRQPYKTRKGKTARRLRSVSSLPTPLWNPPRNGPGGIRNLAQELNHG